MLNRRQFIQTTSLVGISPFLMNTVPVADSLKSFRASLNPGAIGLQCNAQELLDYAIMFNFSSISPLLIELLAFSPNEKKAYLEKMISHGILFDGGRLPIEFRSSEKIFQKGLKFLQKNIKIIASFNIPSFVTWIMPTNKNLTYLQNFNQHQKRLKQVAAVLEEEGLKLGLEYVGPKTLMSRDKYSFLHSISELRELIDVIDKKNVGYLLDSFHTYCAGDQIENMDFLEVKDIVSVQINDAVIGRSADMQIDQERELPGDSGIIDLKKFLDFINSKGYNGAVSVEPFNKEINLMETTKKLKRVRASILKHGF
tara:strand:- start:37 stop:972 length:936 start_codon:yes stop_codon:yes gene_type:complete